MHLFFVFIRRQNNCGQDNTDKTDGDIDIEDKMPGKLVRQITTEGGADGRAESGADAVNASANS